MPTTFLDEFKSYYNITTENTYMVFGSKLESFLNDKSGIILADDPAFSSQSVILYTAYSGTISNDPSSTQKWIIPDGAFMDSVISIGLILYQSPNTLLLRVTNSSILGTIGYPGI